MIDTLVAEIDQLSTHCIQLEATSTCLAVKCESLEGEIARLRRQLTDSRQTTAAGPLSARFVEVQQDGTCPMPPEEVYYCNDEGCWIGTPPQPEPIVLPDGRTLCAQVGVLKDASSENLNGEVRPPRERDAVEGKVVPTNERSIVEGKVTPTNERKAKKRRPASTGLFAPLVVGMKSVMGEQELNTLRYDLIFRHSKVISEFVDTSESPFGQLVLRRMFEAADRDQNGALDREEIRDALHALGFTFIQDKQLNTIMAKSATDDVVDFEAFVKQTPKTLRMSLIKLAKNNGHDLGFLA